MTNTERKSPDTTRLGVPYFDFTNFFFNHNILGKHNYLTLVIHLDDYTDRGLEWKYYEQAEIIDYFDTESEDIEALPPNLQFRKFQGHFGNTEGIGCNILDPIIGVNISLIYYLLYYLNFDLKLFLFVRSARLVAVEANPLEEIQHIKSLKIHLFVIFKTSHFNLNCQNYSCKFFYE